MSTRCNIVLKIGKTTTYIYRHYDGYPAETGADLLQKIEAAVGTPGDRRTPEGAAGALLVALLTATEEATPSRPEPRHHYQLTSEVHGDIEHLYTVRFTPRECSVTVQHAARPGYKTWDESDAWTKGGIRQTLASFRKLVNEDRAEINKRIAIAKAKQPGAYADCADYAPI